MPNISPGPEAPSIDTRALVRQFWRDIYGKEVQSAATYSYLWMADQMGHICIGIILNFAFTALIYQVVYHVKGPWNPEWRTWPYELAGFLITAAVVSYWEYRAFKTDVRKATGVFVLDRGLLRRNAIAAASYMIFGAAVGWAFHRAVSQAIPAALVITLIAVFIAPAWLRQKITWQKAGLPYLNRLADLEASILRPAVEALEELLAAAAPPGAIPRQIVVAGPINSGRTELATGIGTEFAFKHKTVRYLTIGKFLEVATLYALQSPQKEDRGPKNIEYWPFAKTQIVIIDDLGPVIATSAGKSDYGRFKELLEHLNVIGPALAERHTVWILGDVGQGPEGCSELDKYAAAIQSFCRGKEKPLSILLGPKGVRSVHGPEADAVRA